MLFISYHQAPKFAANKYLELGMPVVIAVGPVSVVGHQPFDFAGVQRPSFPEASS